MSAVRVSLVISEAGRTELAVAGISVGWLSAWLLSAGAGHVEVHAFASEALRPGGDGWRVIFAEEAELMRAALQQGLRLGADRDGRRTVLGADTLQLHNPGRLGWLYRQGGGRTLRLPVGDIAHGREAWLHLLNDGCPLLPLRVCLEGEEDGAGLWLEPGLRAFVGEEGPAVHALNDGGYLPEEQALRLLADRGLRLRLAESCTAGGVAARLARVPGASRVLERAWVTYSNAAKAQELGVDASLIAAHGAVSRPVAEAMAMGGAAPDAACIAISGIAGPDGGSPDKPVGTVWIAVQWPGQAVVSQCFCLAGSRAEVQARAVIAALAMLLGVARGDWPGLG
jgi:PncC family amidohydrolase